MNAKVVLQQKFHTYRQVLKAKKGRWLNKPVSKMLTRPEPFPY